MPEYVEHFNVEERDMTKYVIGTISEMDTPLTARAQGARSDAAYFGHVTESDLQKERDQVLYATQEGYPCPGTADACNPGRRLHLRARKRRCTGKRERDV